MAGEIPQLHDQPEIVRGDLLRLLVETEPLNLEELASESGHYTSDAAIAVTGLMEEGLVRRTTISLRMGLFRKEPFVVFEAVEPKS